MNKDHRNAEYYEGNGLYLDLGIYEPHFIEKASKHMVALAKGLGIDVCCNVDDNGECVTATPNSTYEEVLKEFEEAFPVEVWGGTNTQASNGA